MTQTKQVVGMRWWKLWAQEEEDTQVEIPTLLFTAFVTLEEVLNLFELFS